MVFDFIKSLGRSRVSGVESRVKAKKYGAVAKARSKASTKFNNAIDKPMAAAKNKAKGKVASKGSDKKKNDKKDDKKMGLFGKKKGGQVAQEPQVASSDDGVEKTRAFSIDDMVVDDRSQDCVGWVVVLEGELKGRDFRLTPGKNTLGTSADCDVVLTDQYMSSHHATINYEEKRFTLVDLDSTNGTYANDRRVSREEIIDNDSLRVGRTNLKFKSLF